MTKFLTGSIVSALLVPLACFAGAASAPNSTGAISLAEREKLARPILMHAENAATSLEPASRAILLYRTAGAWSAIEQSRAVRLYSEAFASARLAPLSIRQQIEQAILNDLLPMSPSEVLDLLPKATTETKTRLYGAVINFLLIQGKYEQAAHAFEGAISNDVLPKRATTHLLASVLDKQLESRTQTFSAAVEFYESHPDPERFRWNLADLVARFYTQLPEKAALKAIDVVLQDAERRQKEQSSGGIVSLGGSQNGISFDSCYDFQLFAVAPALLHYAPDRAAELISKHPAVAQDLKRYPHGLASLNEMEFLPNHQALMPNSNKPEGLMFYNKIEKGQNLSELDEGLEFNIPRDLFTLGVTGSLVFYGNPNDPETSILGTGNTCPPNVPELLKHARTAVPMERKVPVRCGGPTGDWCSYRNTYPRAQVALLLAERCTYYPGAEAARVALREEMDLLQQVPPESSIQNFATAADLYLRLGDREAAADAVERGFAAAHKVYDVEANSAALREVPFGVWSAAEAYRRMISLGVNSSLERTSKMVESIPEEKLRELERVMIARALLGVPVRRTLTVNQNGSSVSESEVTYDQF